MARGEFRSVAEQAKEGLSPIQYLTDSHLYNLSGFPEMLFDKLDQIDAGLKEAAFALFAMTDVKLDELLSTRPYLPVPKTSSEGIARFMKLQAGMLPIVEILNAGLPENETARMGLALGLQGMIADAVVLTRRIRLLTDPKRAMAADQSTGPIFG